MILRDPVHGLVSFETKEEQIVPTLMDTPEVQRLRRIRQLGVASLAYPSAEHSRFSHSVGATYVMRLFLSRLRAIDHDLPAAQRLTETMAKDALAAALLHDAGHGPLSHLFEDAIPGASHHELWTEKIILDPGTEVNAVLRQEDPDMPRRVAALVHGQHPMPYLAKAVSGELDVDRCDYLLRDAHATGVRYGNFDLEWLFRSLRFGRGELPSGGPRLVIDGAKGLPAIEAFIIARLFMYQQVYLHKATRSSEWMIRKVLSRAAEVIADGTPLNGTPSAVVAAARGEAISLPDYLDLDDGVLFGAMKGWESGPDHGLADLCRRVRYRDLFKTLELFEAQATPDGQAEAIGRACEVARRRGLDPRMYVGLDIASDVPFVGAEEPLMVEFAKGKPRPLHEISFLLSRIAGQELARVRLVFAPELREEIVRAVGA